MQPVCNPYSVCKMSVHQWQGLNYRFYLIKPRHPSSACALLIIILPAVRNSKRPFKHLEKCAYWLRPPCRSKRLQWAPPCRSKRLQWAPPSSSVYLEQQFQPLKERSQVSQESFFQIFPTGGFWSSSGSSTSAL